ncbi:MAG: hypothetical protein FWD94_01650, partial [Treponema sp.]|nr:hypothetical protein [Treponema sp.]
GFVQIGGPSMIAQMPELIGRMCELGADKVIVDGAVGRKSLAGPGITEAAVLCTGASFHADPETVVGETAHVVRMMGLPKMENEEAAAKPEAGTFTNKINIVDNGTIYLQGAVSDNTIEELLRSDVRLAGTSIVVEDPGKVFVGPAVYEKLLRQKAVMKVLRTINLVAVTVNPVSAYGGRFDGDEFLRRMRNAVSVPVFDMKERPCSV